MSVLSDDTDVLLLIPPDFFLIPDEESDVDEGVETCKPESLIVSDLISQVNDLEGRICLIETRCLNESATVMENLKEMRHFGSADALNRSARPCHNTRSLQTTPSKNVLSSCKRGDAIALPETLENTLTSNEYVAQRVRDDELAKEMEQFSRHRRQSGDDPDLSLTRPEDGQLSGNVFNLDKVNNMLKKLDETQREIEDKMKLRDAADIEAEDSLTLGNIDKEADGSDRGERRKDAKRILSFDEDRAREITSVEFHCGEDSVCKSRQVGENGENRRFDGRKSQDLSNLLSLSNLWGSTAHVQKSISDGGDEHVLRQRLEEERCRRQHCESLIQKLQLRLLEEQQKVAVAMKVDREKDEAISKLTEGWNKLVGHWRDLEGQRNNLAKKLLSDREKFKAEVSTAFLTVKRYEVELSKALDLAHGYKEKCEASDREKKTLRATLTKEVETLRREARESGEKLRAEEGRSEKLEKLLETKEELVNQGKAKLSELQNQIRDGRKTLKELQTELENIKADRERTGEKLREERNRVAAAEQSKKALQQQNEELKRREKALRDELKAAAEQMEKAKVELKEFYQDQVETIVQEKLREFQEQLAAAEKNLHAEIEVREKTVTEMAVKQVQQIVEKHLTEVNQLEEKHKEASELWKLQMAQKDEKIKELQKRLEQYSSNKTVIAQRLHSVMEAQWQEALKIITATSPQHVKSPPGSDRSETVVRQKTFTMSSCVFDDGDDNSTTTSTSVPPFCQEGLTTFREEAKNEEPLTYRVDETPQKMSSDHLEKYIKALLERAPGHPTDDSIETTAYKGIESFAEDSTLARWQHILSETSSSQLTAGNGGKYSEVSKPLRENKPPWK